MKIIAISDTHQRHDKIVLPDGDVLVHAGDISGRKRSIDELSNFIEWYKKQPHAHKILVAGNNDKCFENYYTEKAIKMTEDAGIIYLKDNGIYIDGTYFFGQPWQPFFHGLSFNVQRGKNIAKKWKLIPDRTNILITHGPPYGILDEAPRGFGQTEHCGCQDLLERIDQLPNLKAHIFGHIHLGYGSLERNGIKFINAAICTEDYIPSNPPQIIDI